MNKAVTLSGPERRAIEMSTKDFDRPAARSAQSDST